MVSLRTISKHPQQHPFLAEILAQFKQKISYIYQDQLVKLILFGSQARGEAKSDSDIDILVILKNKTINNDEQYQKVITLISDLCLEYEVLISCVYVSEMQFYQEKSPLLLNIEQEGIIL